MPDERDPVRFRFKCPLRVSGNGAAGKWYSVLCVLWLCPLIQIQACSSIALLPEEVEYYDYDWLGNGQYDAVGPISYEQQLAVANQQTGSNLYKTLWPGVSGRSLVTPNEHSRQLYSQLKNRNYVNKVTCSRDPTTDNCLWYDKRYQAETLEEAIANFADLSRDDGGMLAPATETDFDSERCTTDYCKACTQQILRRIVDRSNWVLSRRQIDFILRRLNAADIIDESCPVIEQDQELYENNKQSFNELDVKIGINYLHECLSFNPSFGRSIRRGRQAQQEEQITPAPLAGELTIINCLNRGQRRSKSEEHVSLCTQCWAIRQLPESYYPRYVNEVFCANRSLNGTNHDNDQLMCLSGYGTCFERKRMVVVEYRKQGQTNEIEVEINVCCDCQLGKQTPLLEVIQDSNAKLPDELTAPLNEPP